MAVSTSVWWSRVWLACLCAAAACQSNSRIGSACPNGVCPSQAAVQGPACLLSQSTMEVALGEGSTELCLPRALPTDDNGSTRCVLYWMLPPDASVEASCNDADYLQPADELLFPGDETCVVRHLTAAQRAEGLEGWYYDSDETHPCGVIGAVRFTAGVQHAEGTRAFLRCDTFVARDAQGDVGPIDPDVCAAPTDEPDPDTVGAACLPGIIPMNGFDPREAFLEVGTAQCQTGMCLVHTLDGDPSPDCEPGADRPACPSPEEIERSVYCTCRCDLPEGVSGSECYCPDGFVCAEVIEPGPTEFSGGYCVRSDSISGG